MNPCDYCDEFRDGSNNAFARKYWPEVRQRRLLVHQDFIIVPSLGQLIEGHLLCIPERHYTAMADLSESASHVLEEMTSLIRRELNRRYGACVFFEHGIRNSDGGGCGIEHAHLHAVPVEGGGVLRSLRNSYPGHRVESFNDISDTVGLSSSYLFFEDCRGDRWVFPVTLIESQYMRKLVAASIGKLEWDWRSTGREPELIATLEHLSGVLETAESAVRG